MKYPINQDVPGYSEYRLELVRSSVCVQCDFPATHRVTVRPVGSDARVEDLCALHAADHLCTTDEDGAEGVVGTVAHWHNHSLTYPVRVKLDRFEGQSWWTIEIRFESGWEGSTCGCKRTRDAALQALVTRCHFPLVETTDPLLTSLLNTELALREKRLREAEEKDRRERAEAEACRAAHTAFWDGVEDRLKALKGKHRDVTIAQVLPDGSTEPGTVPATVYGPLALTKDGALYGVTHLPTGLLTGKSFPTQRQAKEAILLLLESGTDWEALTQANITPAQRKVSSALQTAVRNHGLPEFVKLSDVPLDK